jgi:hypothetical protein
MGGEWEDKYLSLKEENERLKELQREQASREHKIAARLVALKEQQAALLDGRAIPGDLSKEAKLAELQNALRALEQQGQLLANRLQSHKPAGSRPSSAGASRKPAGAKEAHTSFEDDALDSGKAHKIIAKLKKEILDANLAFSKLKEQRASQDLLHDSLTQLHTGQQHVGEVKEREDLKKELRIKEAKYTVTKDRLDTLDKEYKEQCRTNDQLSSQAKETQSAIIEQQAQQRELESKIKQLKLQRDQVRQISTASVT